MRKHVPLGLKIACLVLGLSILIQLLRLLLERDPLLGLEDSLAKARDLARTEAAEKAGPAKPEKADPATGEKTEKRAEAPSIPDLRIRTIERSGIFGAEGKKKRAGRPALLGLAGNSAILRLPDGKVDLVAEGSELSGVKVLRIAANRALVEYKGKQIELTIFSGMGSSPLKEQEKETKREKEKRP